MPRAEEDIQRGLSTRLYVQCERRLGARVVWWTGNSDPPVRLVQRDPLQSGGLADIQAPRPSTRSNRAATSDSLVSPLAPYGHVIRFVRRQLVLDGAGHRRNDASSLLTRSPSTLASRHRRSRKTATARHGEAGAGPDPLDVPLKTITPRDAPVAPRSNCTTTNAPRRPTYTKCCDLVSS